MGNEHYTGFGENLIFKKGDRVVRLGSNQVGRVVRVAKDPPRAPFILSDGREIVIKQLEYVYIQFPGSPEVGGWLPRNVKHAPSRMDDNLHEVFG